MRRAINTFGKRHKNYTLQKAREKEEKIRSEMVSPAIANIENITNVGNLGISLVDALERRDEKRVEAREKREGLKKVKKVNIKDLAVPETKVKGIDEEILNIDIHYPVIPLAPKQGEKIYAWASIKWDPVENHPVYKIQEPAITEEDKKRINQIKDVIESEIDINFQAFSKASAVEYLKENITDLIKRFKFVIGPEKMDIYQYYILRDFMGLGNVEPMLNDENIEDISCDGINIPLYVYHRDPRFGSLKTEVVIKTREEVDNLVMRLAQRCGKTISTSEPLLDGSLPDGSRVQATLATDIAPRGSNFTIRRFAKEPLTPIHLMQYGTIDAKVLAYLWYVIERGKSMLVCGATASGKTTLLNALSLFIDPSAKIISIEDTPELKLPHEHWIPEIARVGFGQEFGAKRRGEINMFDLLKSSLRQRPDYIIVGEVRGSETNVLFQQIATGHPGMTTFHADSLEKVVNRLTTKPIDLSESLIETLDLIVFIRRISYKQGFVRRVTDLFEIMGFDRREKELITNKVFEWNPRTDKVEVINESFLMGKICEQEGVDESELKSELKKRMHVLEWMKNKYITHYERVGEVLKTFKVREDDLIALIEEDVIE